MSVENALRSFLEELEQDCSMLEPHRLRQRIEALERFDRYLSPSTSCGDTCVGATLHHRAKTICAKLESINVGVYEAIRRDIRRGAGRESLHRWIPNWKTAADLGNDQGYDYLDELISGILLIGEPATELAPLGAEMVHYQPTPARHIFDLIDRTGLDEGEFLIDLGSGLGQVPLLVSICTGAKCVGIEVEPTYVDCARKSAQVLGLLNVTFIEGDVRSVDLSGGTIFYLYTPFSGTILRDVLTALRREATREIRICTFGPCTRVITEEKWLNAIGAPDPNRIAIFRSRA